MTSILDKRVNSMRHNRNVCYVGNRVVEYKHVHSKFNLKQRYAIDIIVEHLNKALLSNNKLHLVKRPYTKDDVIKLVEKTYKENKCKSYDIALEILNKELKEKNFDIYKS